MKWELILTEVEKSKVEIERLFKCLSVTQYRTVSESAFESNLKSLIEEYNYVTEVLNKYYGNFTKEHKEIAISFLTKIREKFIRLCELLDLVIEIPEVFHKISQDSHQDESDTDGTTMKPEEFLSLASKQISRNYSGDPLG